VEHTGQDIISAILIDAGILTLINGNLAMKHRDFLTLSTTTTTTIMVVTLLTEHSPIQAS